MSPTYMLSANNFSADGRSVFRVTRPKDSEWLFVQTMDGRYVGALSGGGALVDVGGRPRETSSSRRSCVDAPESSDDDTRRDDSCWDDSSGDTWLGKSPSTTRAGEDTRAGAMTASRSRPGASATDFSLAQSPLSPGPSLAVHVAEPKARNEGGSPRIFFGILRAAGTHPATAHALQFPTALRARLRRLISMSTPASSGVC